MELKTYQNIQFYTIVLLLNEKDISEMSLCLLIYTYSLSKQYLEKK